MLDDTRHQERLRRNSHLDEHAASAPKKRRRPRQSKRRAGRLAICVESATSLRRSSSVSTMAARFGSPTPGWETGGTILPRACS